MLAQWDPFTEMSRLHDRVFGRPSAEREYNWRPAVDIYEDDQAIHLEAEVPGVKPQDIKVNIENKILTVSGERKLQHEDKKNGYHRVERFYGTFSRSFALHDEVDPDEIDASYEGGILHLKLPKRPAVRKREITVKG
ncbi:MAG: Hsp20/alpha crystallin family protein [Myxococcales bacterium]|nr:Hsp20/alpha crystallin family protein [Myxococcales bacterium]